ncbi:type II toxin-antitoxin system RelB/DinJ family antitoxin [Methylobacterium sp. J-088]|uniref:type II toxin-antitoxin system RelB/DinJ family antitoxin n=1 Tax=unclassified Methylobacterium TaxID=2615210 RepID=UPI001FB9DFF7|nr:MULTISPECIES: type II toxin-antitoxin system RelB/DinJ family antitoxin [unclassified Methylobacterium]MCJ2064766.1 type II toxin-antitoxin system RelB/DinJ family antitoxin [Methylobacterium sp. J-088]
MASAQTKAKTKPAPRTRAVRVQVDAQVKLEAEAVLGAVGLSLSEAFRLMLHRVVADRRLPFDPLVPNEETSAALRADLAGDVIHVGNPSNLLAALDAD